MGSSTFNRQHLIEYIHVNRNVGSTSGIEGLLGLDNVKTGASLVQRQPKNSRETAMNRAKMELRNVEIISG